MNGLLRKTIALLLCLKVENVGTDAPPASLTGYLSVMKEKTPPMTAHAPSAQYQIMHSRGAAMAFRIGT